MGGIDTHGYLMKNGKYAGERITRVPVSYLRWMVNIAHQDAAIAAAELKRRGTILPDIEISGHALDRASLRCWGLWKLHRKDEEEGMHAWLVRAAGEALEQGEDLGEGARLHLGIKWVFAFGEVYPTLKTVMPKRPRLGGVSVAPEGDQAEFLNEDHSSSELFGDDSPW